MAKKPLPISPPLSSSEEESSSSSDDENPSHTKPVPQSQANNNNKEGESDDETGDDDEDEDADAQPHKKKPQYSNNNKAHASPQTPSKPNAMADSKAAKHITPTSSRPVTKSHTVAEKSDSKLLFQRIWTLDDEVTILKGMAEYQSERDPVKMNSTAIADFHDFVKKNLSVEVTNSQFSDKIRKLKKKYLVVADRARHGEPLKFLKPHDQTVYELGKKVWVKELEDEHEGKAKGASVNSSGGGRSLKRNFPFLKEAVEMLESRFSEEALETIDLEKAAILEKRLKKQKAAEMKHHLHEMELRKDTFKLVLHGIERAAG